MKFYRSKIAKILLVLLAFFAVSKFCRKQTDGFRVIKTQAATPFNPSWENPPLSTTESEEIQNILSQKFHFLGSGVQSYAFLSDDGKTVLKFFKHYHMWPNTQLLQKISLPLNFVENTVEERHKRMSYIFNSCKIAHKECEEQTGVFYLQLNPSPGFPKIRVFDKLNIAHEIDLKTTPFLLQRKAVPLCPYISQLMKKGDVQEAKKSIESVLILVQNRMQKGVLNTDRKFCRNVGFFEGKAIHIDIGSFDKSSPLQDPAIIQEEAEKELLEFKVWLKKEHPMLIEYFEESFNSFFNDDKKNLTIPA